MNVVLKKIWTDEAGNPRFTPNHLLIFENLVSHVNSIRTEVDLIAESDFLMKVRCQLFQNPFFEHGSNYISGNSFKRYNFSERYNFNGQRLRVPVGRGFQWKIFERCAANLLTKPPSTNA